MAKSRHVLTLAVLVLVLSVFPWNLHVRAANCSFVLGFQALHDQIPDTVGDCVVDQRYNPENGDALQETTGGLLVWRKADNFTAFTDGYRSWVSGPYGVQERLNSERFDWEADDSQLSSGTPPQPSPSTPSQVSPGPTSVYLPSVPNGDSYASPVLPLGVQLDRLSDPILAGRTQQMGARWARVGVSWSTLEPSNTTADKFNWSPYDADFASASQYSILPVVTISGNPSWAADTTCGPIRSASLQDFSSFLQALVGRYSKAPYNVHYWELYNEPDNVDAANHSWLGGCWGSNGTDYANMLKVAYPAIKGVDPQAQVLLGSVAYDGFTTDGGVFNKSFLDDVLSPTKGNGGAYFDILGFHFYPAFRDNWAPYGTDVLGKINYLKTKEQSYGVNKPLAVTEINMWSAAKYGGSDTLQSDYVIEAMVRSWSAGLKFAIWFSLADWNDWGYGLLRTDLSQKPAYTAYRTLSAMMAGAVYSGALQIGGSPPGNVEGYTFVMPGGRQRHVLWATDNGIIKVAFPGSSAVVTDKNGTSTSVADSADGAVDGRVNLSVTTSPIYVDVS